jgi:predicted  nucleic acid-binding Zn-ribbon protein
MHPDLEKLLALQDVDREIARLTEEISALPRRVAEIETKLAGAKAGVEQTNNAIKGNETARRNLESDIKSHQEKISKYKSQSLEVKTNEQYKALMHEISFAEQDIRAAEDKILDLMEGTEAQEKAVKAAEAALKAQSADVEREKSEAKALTAKDEQALAEWAKKRNELRSAVSENMLAHYDRVIRTRRPALSEARDQKCSACNVMLRPQKYNELKMGGDVQTCDACSRILYYDPAHEPPPPPEQKKKKKKVAAEEEFDPQHSEAETTAH